MEVHHHAHTPRKKWTHYFWEFLMLFLAVTLGFLVENSREHFIEDKREKVYAKSLMDDLKIDTAVLHRTIDEKTWAVSKMDSLQYILSLPANNRPTGLIYYFERFITQSDIFSSQDITYQQLKSSGNFRYIHNMELYKNIADYYNLYSRYLLLAESKFNDYQELTAMEARLFDGNALSSLYNWKATTFYDLFNRPDGEFPPLLTDKEAMNIFTIKIANAKYASVAAIRFLVWLEIKATELIDLLKKEYHLE